MEGQLQGTVCTNDTETSHFGYNTFCNYASAARQPCFCSEWVCLVFWVRLLGLILLYTATPPSPHLSLASSGPPRYPQLSSNPDTGVPLTVNKDTDWQQLSLQEEPFAQLPHVMPDLCSGDAPSHKATSSFQLLLLSGCYLIKYICKGCFTLDCLVMFVCFVGQCWCFLLLWMFTS